MRVTAVAAEPSRLQQTVDVEPFGEHVKRAVGMARPFLAWAVPGELESVVVGVTQVEGLVGAMVAGAVERDPRRDQTTKRVGERGPRRVKDGGMIEARRPGGW